MWRLDWRRGLLVIALSLVAVHGYGQTSRDSLRVGRNVFARDSAGALIHYTWTESAGWVQEDLTSAFPGLEMDASDAPRSVVTANGAGVRADVFGRNAAGELVHYWWTEAQGAWSATNATHDWPGRIPALASDPVAAGTIEGGYTRLDLFARGQAGQLLHLSLVPGAPVVIPGWTVEAASSPTFEGEPEVLSAVDNGHLRFDVFARNATGALIHYERTFPGALRGRNLSPIRIFPLLSSAPEAIVSRQGGQLRYDVFGRGASGQLVHYSRSLAPPAAWRAEIHAGPSFQGQPDAILSDQNGSRRLDVFARDESSHLVHYWWSEAPPAEWAGEQLRFGSPVEPVTSLIAGDPIAVSVRDGAYLRHDVFATSALGLGGPVHFSWSARPPGGWRYESLAGEPRAGTLDVRAGTATGHLRIDVFDVEDLGGDLEHLGWSELDPGVWNAAIVPSTSPLAGRPRGMKGPFDVDDQ